MKLPAALCAMTLAAAVATALAADPPAPRTKASALNTDPHLVGWWKFDETTGKTAVDSSTHHRDGTLEGGLMFNTHGVPGQAGKAISLDGGHGCIRIHGYKGVTGTGPRTVAVWMKTAAASGEVISWGTNDSGKLWSMAFIRRGLGVTPKGGYLYMKPGLHDNAWHHVAVVVQEASPPNLHDHVKLYKDGEPAVIDDIGLLDMFPIETGDKQDVRIGWQLKGALDELRIYDRALSEEEIRMLFELEGGKPGKP
jgi:hypothetical protein